MSPSTSPLTSPDIPLPPPDAALPALGTALDGDAMRELLGEGLRGFAVLSCEPVYIRYKPATSCRVQYRVSLQPSEEGRQIETLAQTTLYTGRRAEKVWSKGSLQELARAARCTVGGPRPEPVAYLSSLGAIFEFYPVDRKLPALMHAASAEGAHRVLRAAFVGAAADSDVQLVRYKPARKALLRYGPSIYAKLHVDDRGPLVLHAARRLLELGVATATPVAHLPSWRLLAWSKAPGLPLRLLREKASLRDGAAAAGEALARLHAVRITGLRHHTWNDEGAELVAAGRAIGRLLPDRRAEAQAVASTLCAQLRTLPALPATAHGDFSDDQVLVSSSGAVLLDLDEIRAAHPLLDVGNFLGHLAADDVDMGARDAFLGAYGGPRDHVPLVEAAALLKLAVGPFRRLEHDWPTGLERRLELAEQRLRAYRPPRRKRSGDPGLPQLALLLDPEPMAREFESLFGKPVRVEAIDAVRHKPGRRCTLRYDLAIGRRRERVYAKTYAKDRAPRVHAVLAAITSGEACGPEVSLPEPLGYIRRLRLVVQREVAGEPATSRLLAGDESLAVRIAAALSQLHSSRIELPRTHELGDELAIVSARLVELPARLSGSARECLKTAARQMDECAWRLRPIHRDLYQEQVLVDGDRIALLDFDSATLSEPAVDVANLLAHLRLLALDEPQSAQAVDVVATAFESAYSALDPDLDLRLVRLLEATTLLRLACIHFPRGGERLAEQLIVSGATLVEEAA